MCHEFLVFRIDNERFYLIIIREKSVYINHDINRRNTHDITYSTCMIILTVHVANNV